MQKCLLVLGSNSEIGIACAYRFAQEGYNLILAARRQDDFQKKLAADLRIRHKVNVVNVFFDAQLFDHHLDFYTSLNAQPDIVLSVIGHLGEQEEAIKDFTQSQAIINANYSGLVSILNVVSTAMSERGAGTIIGVSSVAGERGRGSNYLYGSAKAGFTAYLSGLRQALYSEGVHVITIIPGFVKTKMIAGLATPPLLTASPEQVAKTIWKAYQNKRNKVFVLPLWRWIMLIIRNIPTFIFKRLRL